MQPCGRKLRCGNHLCPSPCHAGPCQPCPLSASIACACGRTSYSTPCGTESSAKPPNCPLVRPHSPTLWATPVFETSCEDSCTNSMQLSQSLSLTSTLPPSCILLSGVVGAPSAFPPTSSCPARMSQQDLAGTTVDIIAFVSMVGCDALHKLAQDCPVPRTCLHAKDLPPHPCHFGPCPSCTELCGMTQVRQPSCSFSAVFEETQRGGPESL